MSELTRRLGAPAAAVMLILALAAGGAVAASFDTETADTSGESDVSGTSTTVTWNYSSADDYLEVQTDGVATDNVTLELRPAADGVNHTLYSNESWVNTTPANSGQLGHKVFNISGDEIPDLPRGEDGGTYDLWILNNSTGDEILETEVTLDQSDDGETTAVIWVADNQSAMTSQLADSLDITTESAGFWSLQTFSMGLVGGNDSGPEIASWSGYTTIDGDNTTTEIHLQNATSADAYDRAAEDLDDGEWMTESTVWVNNIPAKIYKNSAPDDVDNATTYAVYDVDADTLTITHGDDLVDTGSATVRGTGGNGYGFGTLWSEYGALTALDQNIDIPMVAMSFPTGLPSLSLGIAS